MQAIPWRWQLGVIGSGYAFLIACGGVLLYLRHMQYVNHPEDAAAYGSMWAFGDLLLAIFIFALFMIPTLFLARLIGQFEHASTMYAKLLLVLAITAPVCLGVMYLARKFGADNLADLCLWRLLCSPFVTVLLGTGRLFARFKAAKTLTNYALLVELATFLVIMLLIVFAKSAV